MNLRDKAFEFAKGASDASGHAAAKDKLQQSFPGVVWDDIVSSYLDACRLSDAAYDFGDRMIRGLLSEQQALAEAKKKFPGFSDTTYRAFLSYSTLISR